MHTRTTALPETTVLVCRLLQEGAELMLIGMSEKCKMVTLSRFIAHFARSHGKRCHRRQGIRKLPGELLNGPRRLLAAGLTQRLLRQLEANCSCTEPVFAGCSSR